MKKKVTLSEEAKSKLLVGIDTVANSVKSTLGPGGRLVVIEDFHGNVFLTKDGVTVAKSIELSDRVEDMGCQLIKQVASKTVETAGDGTTTSVVLAQKMISAGLQAIKDGANPVDLANEIKNATAKAIEHVKSQSISIQGDWDKVKQIAVISANGDVEHAHMIVDAIQKIGDDGVMVIEAGGDMKSKIEIVHGMEFGSGYLSPFFVNNNKNECVFEYPVICVTTDTLSLLKEQILPVMKYAHEKQKPLLFICNNAIGEGFASMLVNRNKQNFPLCAVNAPEINKGHDATMDVAIVTGATVLGAEFGKEIKDSKEVDYGTAKKVVVTKDSITIIGGSGSQEKIQERIDSLKAAIEIEKNDKEKDSLKKRLAKLSGGIAMVSVGGVSEAAIRELKDRMDDAHQAVRCAIEGGVVPGGGIALLNARAAVDLDIVREALEEPFRQILSNAGLDPKSYLYDECWTPHTGLNVRTGQTVNMIEEGVIDATKVVVSALENAADIACLLLTSNVVVTNTQETPKAPMRER